MSAMAPQEWPLRSADGSLLPLPARGALIEASAGTGKTYQTEGIILRLLAEEGIAVDRVLVITFTRAATAELRGRVHGRLVQAEAALRTGTGGADDGEIQHLLRRADRGAALSRIQEALANFDQAPISTIHSFCQRALAEHGLQGGFDPAPEVQGTSAALLQALVGDALGAVAARATADEWEELQKLGWTSDGLQKLAEAATQTGSGALVPAVDPPPQGAAELAARALDRLRADPSAGGSLADFAAWVRLALPAARAAAGVLDYNSMVDDLARALRAEDGRAHQPLRGALRQRYAAALVDEFQDTDGAQWDILRAVFLESPDHRLYAVGDPKQAIYRFRGASLQTYLAAGAALERAGALRASLTTNRRSDTPLVDALNRAWRGDEVFGVPGVRADAMKGYHPLRTPDLGPPIEVQELATDTKRDRVHAAATRVCELVRQGLQASDIAVLVDRHEEARDIQRALRAAGVASVRGGGVSIFGTDAAGWLTTWLEAVDDAGRESPSRRLALSPLVGWTPDELDAALVPRPGGPGEPPPPKTPADWDGLRGLVRAAREAWPQRGVARTFHALAGRHGLTARLRADGADDLADLRDLLQRLHREERRARLPLAALRAWLVAQRADASDNDENQQREVDLGQGAVQISTVPASKGLQYGVVLVPFSISKRSQSGGQRTYPQHADPASSDGGRLLAVHPPSSTAAREAGERAASEADQELVRKLYVAMTRAKHKVIAWVPAPPLDAGHPLKPVVEAMRAAAEQGDPGFAWTRASSPRAALPLAPPKAKSVVVRPWVGHTSWGAWRVTSYSGMSAGRGVDLAHPADDAAPPAALDDGGASGQPAVAADAPPLVDCVPPAVPPGELGAPAPGAGLPGGTRTGDFLHAVLEHLDFEVNLDDDAVRDGVFEMVVAQSQRHGLHSDERTHAELVTRLLPAWLDTPLRCGHPESAGELRLRDLTRKDRADEYPFDLKLGLGLQRGAAGQVRPEAARAALDAGLSDASCKANLWLRRLLSRLDAAEAEKAEAERAEAERAEAAKANRTAALPRVVGLIPKIQGMLNGSIDLVLRDRRDRAPRYFVADYKSNQLWGPDSSREITRSWPLAEPPPGPPRDVLRRWHYTEGNMAWGMAHTGYHLQALLYTVAVHRWLKLRVPGYTYREHFGGHFYLFLRGMEGAAGVGADGQVRGVWHDRWPEATVIGLDLALTGASADDVQRATEGVSR